MSQTKLRRKGTAAAVAGAMLAGTLAIAYFSTLGETTGSVTGAALEIAFADDGAFDNFGADLFPISPADGTTVVASDFYGLGAYGATDVVSITNPGSLPTTVALTSVEATLGSLDNLWIGICETAEVDASCVIEPAATASEELGTLAAGGSLSRNVFVWLAESPDDQNDISVSLDFYFQGVN